MSFRALFQLVLISIFSFGFVFAEQTEYANEEDKYYRLSEEKKKEIKVEEYLIINNGYQSPNGRGTYTISVIAGGFGSEMAWNLQDAQGNEVASGGSQSNCSTVTASVDLSAGTYTFNAIDTYGDGWNYSGGWSGCGYYGYWNITDASGALIAGTASAPTSSAYVPGSGTSTQFTAAEDVIGCLDANANNTDSSANTNCADDNLDGYPDCCSYDNEQSCTDSADEDGDGSADCADSDCALTADCLSGGDTCADAVQLSLPIVDFAINTADYADDYDNPCGSALGISSNISCGNDYMLQFTLDNPAVLSGSLTSTSGSTYPSIVITSACPDVATGDDCIGFLYTSSTTDDTFSNTDVVPAGTYTVLAANWCSPQSSAFTFSLSAAAVIEACTDSDADNYDDTANASCADDDGDGYADCCNYSAEQSCSDGEDEDGDGSVDCADTDCSDASICDESQNCTDGVDNDLDGDADCDDSDCASTVVDCDGVCGGSNVPADGYDCAGACTREFELELNLNDSYGDGWNGNSLSVNGSNYTVSSSQNSGDWATYDLCLDAGTYTATYNASGSFQSENSWDIKLGGEVIASSGGSCSSGCDDTFTLVTIVAGCTNSWMFNYNPAANQDDGSCVCANVETQVTISHNADGNYACENGFDLLDSDGNTIANSNGDDISCQGQPEGCSGNGVCGGQTNVVCLADGDYFFQTSDYPGNGWNLNTFSIVTGQGLDLTPSNNTLDSGIDAQCDGGSCFSDGFSYNHPFTIGDVPIPGCTDTEACNYNEYATVENGSCDYADPYWADTDGDGLGAGDITNACSQPAGSVPAGPDAVEDSEPNCYSNDTDTCGVCAGDGTSCNESLNCADGLDNDNDGNADCADDECASEWACDPTNIAHEPNITTNPNTSSSGTLYDDGGADGNYSNSTNEYYYISTDSQIKIEFSLVDFETCCDYIKLCNWDVAAGTGTCTTINTAPSEAWISTGSDVFIRQFSDGSVNKQGFALTWSPATADVAADISAFSPSVLPAEGSATASISVSNTGDIAADGTTTSLTISADDGVEGVDDANLFCELESQGSSRSDGDIHDKVSKIMSERQQNMQNDLDRYNSSQENLVEKVNNARVVAARGQGQWKASSTEAKLMRKDVVPADYNTSYRGCDDSQVTSTVPAVYECTDLPYYNTQYGETCATFDSFPQWCGDANDSGGTGYDACCACGGGTEGDLISDAYDVTDAWGYTSSIYGAVDCAWVETNILGTWDYPDCSVIDSWTDNGVSSADACCACGGGVTFPDPEEGDCADGLDGTDADGLIDCDDDECDNDAACVVTVNGCTDSNACNFNADATDDDGSCALADGCDTCSQEATTVTECVNDDSIADSFGDTCSAWYDDNPDHPSYGCDSWDLAATLCCACGGGNETSTTTYANFTDGTGVVLDGDADDDTVCNDSDLCEGENDLDDADSDGLPDACDACPSVAQSDDTDNDCVANATDACEGFNDAIDGDGDGTPDGCDQCEVYVTSTDPADCVNDDSIADGYGDTCTDWYDDNWDSASFGCDSWSLAASLCCACGGGDYPSAIDATASDDSADADSDGLPDGCDTCPNTAYTDDTDSDCVANADDTCPGSDDALDADSDSVADGCDQCPGENDLDDADSDGLPDACDSWATISWTDNGDGSYSTDITSGDLAVGSSFSQNIKCSMDDNTLVGTYSFNLSTSSGSDVLASSSSSLENIGEQIPGCMDSTACNYDQDATFDDSTCWFASSDCACGDGQGATIDNCGVCDTDASNDDASCTGCMDDGTLSDSPYGVAATNYDASATINDLSSCTYGTCAEMGLPELTLTIDDSYGDGNSGSGGQGWTITNFGTGHVLADIAPGSFGSSISESDCINDGAFLLEIGCDTYNGELSVSVDVAELDGTTTNLYSGSGADHVSNGVTVTSFGYGEHTPLIGGCMEDDTAANYNPNADYSNESLCLDYGDACEYPYVDPMVVGQTYTSPDNGSGGLETGSRYYSFTASVTGTVSLSGLPLNSSDGSLSTSSGSTFAYWVYEVGNCDEAIAFGQESGTFETFAGNDYVVRGYGVRVSSWGNYARAHSITIDSEEWFPTNPTISAVGGADGTVAVDFSGINISAFAASTARSANNGYDFSNVKHHGLFEDVINNSNNLPGVRKNKYIDDENMLDVAKGESNGLDINAIIDYYKQTGNETVIAQLIPYASDRQLDYIYGEIANNLKQESTNSTFGSSRNALFSETFDDGTLGQMTSENSFWTAKTNTAGDGYAEIDSDAAGSGVNASDLLISPEIDVTEYVSLSLDWRGYLNLLGSAPEDALVECFDGTDWQEAASYNADVGSSSLTHVETTDLSICLSAGSAFKFRLNYDDNDQWAWYWRVAELSLTGVGGDAVIGCMDDTACNYDDTATSPGDCTYASDWCVDQDGDGLGAGSATSSCAAVEGQVSNCSDADDACFSNVIDCRGICDGTAVEDICGECEGDGSTCAGALCANPEEATLDGATYSHLYIIAGGIAEERYYSFTVTEADSAAYEKVRLTFDHASSYQGFVWGPNNIYQSTCSEYSGWVSSDYDVYLYESGAGVDVVDINISSTGTYVVALESNYWAEMSGTASFELYNPPQPDLAVTNIGDYDSATDTYEVTVTNNGAGPPNSGYYVYISLLAEDYDGDQCISISDDIYTYSYSPSDLDPGESVTVTIPCTGAYGACSYQLLLDSECLENESDESNNLVAVSAFNEDPDNGQTFSVHRSATDENNECSTFELAASILVESGVTGSDFADSGLALASNYCYYVTQSLSDTDCALLPDCVGGVSAPSDIAQALTWQAVPSSPQVTLTSDVDARTVTVDWDAANELDASYTVYQWIETPACNPGFVLDCAGNCVDSNYASQDTWLGDGYCDCDPGDDGAGPNGSCPEGYPTQTDGESAWGIDFYCEEWNWDYGDCEAGDLGRLGQADGKEIADVVDPIQDSRDSEAWTAIATVSDATEYTVSGYDEGCFDVVIIDTYGQSSDAPLTENGTSDGTCIDICNQATGDLNDDETLNVLDIVSMIGYILSGGGLNECQLIASDINGDSVINILDVVSLVNTVVNGRTDIQDASSATIINTDEMININAKGYVGAVQMTLTHGPDFEFVITDKAFVSSYHQDGNTTKLMVVLPEGDELLTISNGTYEIEEVIVANSFDQIDALIAPRDFSLSSAYPNPFNPVTSMQMAMPQEGFASVKVFDVLGREIATLVDGNLEAKLHVITWNASNISSGVYFVRAIAGESVQTQKIMLMK